MRYPWRSVLGWFVVLSLSRPAVLAEPPQASPRTPAQQQRLDEAKRLAKQAEDLRKSGKLAEAGAALAKILAIKREVYGDRHEAVADALEGLAEVQEEREDFPAARKARQEVLTLQTQLHGEKHWKVTDARLALADTDRLARLSRQQRQTLAEAKQLTERAIQLRDQGKGREALVDMQKALPLWRDVLGEEHPNYAFGLRTLGMLYYTLGAYAKVEPLFRQALAIRKRTLGENHPVYGDNLGDLAALYKNMGAYAKAEPLYHQALAILKQTVGEDHVDYVRTLGNLAFLYHAMGVYAKAESLYLKSLAIYKKTVGEDHIGYATSLQSLAILYRDMGVYTRAEPLARQAVAITEKLLGEDHPYYANSLHNLAMVYRAMGAYSQAEPLNRQALAIYQKAFGEDHPVYANSLHNLATLYQAMGEYAKAEPLYQKAQAIAQKTRGENHVENATSFINLGLLYQTTGAYAKAEPLFRQALTIRQQALTKDHPDYATSLDTLAVLYLAIGDPEKAEPLLRQAQTIFQASLTEDHPRHGKCLNDLASLYLRKGEPAQALPFARQGLAINEHFWQDTFAALSERQRLQFLHSLRGALDGYLSAALAVKEIPAAEVYRHVLAWKGAVAARLAEERLSRDQPELRPLVEQLAVARTRLARLAFTVPAPQQREAWLRQLNDLRTERESLESQLARRSQPFRTEQQRRRLEPADVARALPKATAFLDVLEYTHTRPPQSGKGPSQVEQRLLAFVLSPDRPLVCVSLQAVAPIAQAVQTWRQALTTGDTQAQERAAAELGARLWKPLQPHLTDSRTVLVAPDGILTQFPLAALPGRRPGSYLLEDLAIGYVTSGRQVIELFREPAPTKAHGLLALGGIDYRADPGGAAPALVLAPRAQVAARERSGFGFLPGTELEAQRCQELFRQAFPQEPALLLTGAAANEGRFKRECGRHWRYLHLATHDFFESPTRLAALLRASALSETGHPPGAEAAEAKALALAPLLRSGIVLAGAARDQEALAPGAAPVGEDGILTAEEAAALDLRGCELVVLSACDTGLGEVNRGEGVLGLQRAFQTAGARTLVASLWRVDDAATTMLMEEFYANLWQKKLSKLEALRQAQLTVLRQPARVREQERTLRTELAKRGLGLKAQPLPEGGKVGDRSPPAWWAGFVLSGAGH